MNRPPQDLYLDLIKKTLLFELWPEPPLPVDVFNYQRKGMKRALVSLGARLLDPFGYQVVKTERVPIDAREEGKYWPQYAFTMVGRKRLENLEQCVQIALRDGVPGDLIETGVWRGGSCILMRAILAATGTGDRRVFVADSFAGLPEPELDRFPADEGSDFHVHPMLAVSLDEVRSNFAKFDLLDDQVVFLKGWFKDTLPTAPIERLAVLRLDGDMYSSTMDALSVLYPKLSAGGFCIVDDFAIDGCKQAVEDYCRRHEIRRNPVQVDWTGVYWRKT